MGERRSRESAVAARVKTLRIVNEGILYRNPAPGHVAICAFYPSLIAFSDRELLCVYRIGQALYSDDGRLAKLRSTDGGKSWVQEGLMWDPRHDAEGTYSYTAPFISRLPDGMLILVAKRSQVSAVDHAMFNPATGGKKPTELVLFQSRDDGRSWSAPQMLDLPDGDLLSAHASVLKVRSGRWMLCCEQWKRWDDQSPLHIRGFAIFSDDGGRSWRDRFDFPSAAGSRRMFSHTQYRQRRDGRIWATQWAQSIGGQDNYDLHLVTAGPSGTDWSQPQPTGIHGQTSCIGELSDGNPVVCYSLREGKTPGVMVTMSRDGGRTWDLDGQVQVWDAVGQEFLGVAHKPSYPASHDNIAFGKPDTVVLPCGEVIVSWWCTQACVTHMRYARLSPK
jgi:sialidase-1